MAYIIEEIQTLEDRVVTLPTYKNDERPIAEQEYHTRLAAAAVSGLVCHAVTMLDSEGKFIKREAYKAADEDTGACIIVEIQTFSDGTVAPITFKKDSKPLAEQQYHTSLAAAAVSALPFHSVAMLDKQARMIKREMYRHDTEPQE